MLLRPPISTLFPYTTLFRSDGALPRRRHDLRRPHLGDDAVGDRKSTRLNSSHLGTSYAVFCLKKKRNGHSADTAASANRERIRGWRVCECFRLDVRQLLQAW